MKRQESNCEYAARKPASVDAKRLFIGLSAAEVGFLVGALLGGPISGGVVMLGWFATAMVLTAKGDGEPDAGQRASDEES